jgi:hypothetical protein
MINAVSNINDKRLTAREKHLLRQIALRLAGLQPRHQSTEIKEVFGPRESPEESRP